MAGGEVNFVLIWVGSRVMVALWRLGIRVQHWILLMKSISGQ